ncbi:MarR family transcriptional regulator [Nakamurella sp. YIM 132087]|uniref:MarR family transcriptional regulator n=1 Tax=Nakamurella alba TaxID=2665158 RepID=A0A7K1FP16_9ACTN|nr:MarR family transcriptional regulator [Nakamurella alba]MTD15891.1 MarR family transcriptional regulator [Nakamurella alba]
MSDPVEEIDLRRIEEQIALLFRRARTYSRSAAAEVHPDLAPAAFSMLVRIVDAGALRTAELIEIFGIDKAAISRQVNQLVALGLADRSADPTDRRAQIIEPTADGTARCRAATARSRGALRSQLQEWTPGEVRDLGRLLARFNTLTMGPE